MNNKIDAVGKKISQKKRRFNFIDLLIIVAVLLLGAIVVNLFFPNTVFNFSNNTEKEIQYTVEFLCVDEALIDKVEENDTVIDSVSKYSVGKVMVVDSNTPYSELEYDNEGGIGKLAVYEGKYNVLVTISVTADYEEGEGYSVGGRRIAVGEKMELRFPDFAAEGYCINLSVAE